MIFTSKRPEDFDPEPWLTGMNASEQRFANRCTCGCTHYNPRPSFQPTRDPQPWQNRLLYSIRLSEPPRHNRSGYRWAPRPEFTTPSNPILVGIREYDDLDAWESAFASFDAFGGYDLWEHPKNPFRAFTVATSEQVEHARKVLTRLVAFS